MNTDDFLLDKFKRESEIYDKYIYPGMELDQIIGWQVSEIMYLFLIGLAKESNIVIEKHEKIFRILQYDVVEELCGQLPYHEGILILQSMIGGKFYRDHLKHMLRVMLLSHLIGQTLILDDDELLACALAGLFHDIAYPLSKAKETIDQISQSLKQCYPNQKIQVGSLQLASTKNEISKILTICKVNKLRNLGVVTNHAIQSAMAFLNLWNSKRLQKDRYLENVVHSATQSIALHDSEIKGTSTYSQDPVSTILILADELQDWGRPVGWEESSWIPVLNIDSLQVTKENISATFDYSGSHEYYTKTWDVFSPLLQIQSKQKNLSRIVLDNDFPVLSLTYKLPTYFKIMKD